MAEKEQVDDDKLHAEGREDKAPNGEGNRDTEEEAEVIPHSAKALADYHDGLKDLSAAAEHHHGELLKEMKKHHGAMEHPAIKKVFGKCMERHQKALDGMIGEHKALCKEMEETFEKHHPDLEPLSEDADEANEETRDKPTSETRESRTEREEEAGGAGKSTSAAEKERPREFSTEGRREEAESGVAMRDGSFPIRNEQDLKDAIHDIGRAKHPEEAKSHIRKRAAALHLEHLIPEKWGEADPPMATKSADELDDEAEQLLLKMLDRIDRKGQDIETRLVKTTGQAG